MKAILLSDDFFLAGLYCARIHVAMSRLVMYRALAKGEI